MIKYIAFILIVGLAAANRNKDGGGGPYLISYPLPVPFIGFNNHGGGGHGGGYGGSYSSHGGPYLIDANDVTWAEPPKGYY